MRFRGFYVEFLLAFPSTVEFSLSFNHDQVSSIHPECRFHLEIQEEEMRCAELLKTQTEKHKGKADRCLVRLSLGWTGGLASSLHLTQKTGVYSHLCLFLKKKSLLPLFFNELLAKLL